MERIIVKIVPERELPAYHPGEMVRGRIVLRAKERIQFSNLEVSLFSRALEGDGLIMNGQQGNLDKSGELTPERDSTYRFAFQVPEEPEQWDNRHQFSWHIRLTANIPDDFGLDEELKIWVVAPGEERQLLQETDEQLQEPGRPGQPGKLHVKSLRAAPVPVRQKVDLGYLAGALLVGLVPLAFMVGGMVVALNGFPNRNVPGGVKVFGMLAVMGAFFVLRKVTEVKGAETFFRWINGGIALLISMVGFIIMFLNEDFSWTSLDFGAGDQSLLDYPKGWNFWMGFCAGTIFMSLAGHMFSGARTNIDKLVLLLFAAPLSLASLWLAASLLQARSSSELPSETVAEGWMGVVICGALALYLLIKPVWRNAPFAFVAFSVTPLLVVALLSLGEGSFGIGLSVSLLLLSAYFVYMGSRNLIAQWQLGPVRVHCDPLPDEVLLGNTQVVLVEFTPRSEVVIDHIEALWKCELHTVTMVGTDRRTDTQVIFTHRDHQARSVKVQRGQFHRSECSFLFLPSLKPSSTSSPEVVWTLEVRIVVAGKPDWDTVIPLSVKSR